MSHGTNTMSQRVEAEAARLGFFKVKNFGNTGHKIAWEITCSKCNKLFRAFWPPQIPTESITKNMRVRGWDIGIGMRPLCKDCRGSKDLAPLAKPENQSFDRHITEPTSAVYHALLAAANTTITRKVLTEKLDEAADTLIYAKERHAQASDQAEALRREEKKWRREEREKHREARRAARLEADAEAMRQAALKLDEENMNSPNLKITHSVFQLLDSVFDPNKRLYRASYNDARVAKDCGTTEEHVANLRREVYGELSEDPRIQAIKDDITLLEMQMQEAMAAIQKNVGGQIADMRSRLEQLRVNIAR